MVSKNKTFLAHVIRYLHFLSKHVRLTSTAIFYHSLEANGNNLQKKLLLI